MAINYEKDGVRIGLLASEKPPATRSGNRDRVNAIDAVLPLLKEHRGTWFRIAEYPKRSAASSAAGRCRKAHRGFEFRGSTTAKGSVLYARWVGK